MDLSALLGRTSMMDTMHGLGMDTPDATIDDISSTSFTSPSANSAPLVAPSPIKPGAATSNAGLPSVDLSLAAMRAVSPPTPAPSPQPESGRMLSTQPRTRGHYLSIDPAGTPLSPADAESRMAFAGGARQTVDGYSLSNGHAGLEEFVEAVASGFSELSVVQRRLFFATLLPHMAGEDLLNLSQLISPRLRRDFLADLPAEIAFQIVSYIDDPKDLVRAARVSKTWRSLVSDEQTWKVMLDKYNARGWPGKVVNSTRPPIERIRQSHPEATFTSIDALVNSSRAMMNGWEADVRAGRVDPNIISDRPSRRVAAPPAQSHPQQPAWLSAYAITSGPAPLSAPAPSPVAGRSSAVRTSQALSPTAPPFKSRTSQSTQSSEDASIQPSGSGRRRKHRNKADLTISVEREVVRPAAASTVDVAQPLLPLASASAKGKGRAEVPGAPLLGAEPAPHSTPDAVDRIQAAAHRGARLSLGGAATLPWQLSGLGFAARRDSHAPALSSLRSSQRAAAGQGVSNVSASGLQPVAASTSALSDQMAGLSVAPSPFRRTSVAGESTIDSPTARFAPAYDTPVRAAFPSSVHRSSLSRTTASLPIVPATSASHPVSQAYNLPPPPLIPPRRSIIGASDDEVDSSQSKNSPDSPTMQRTPRTVHTKPVIREPVTQTSSNPFGISLVHSYSDSVVPSSVSRKQNGRKRSASQPISYKTQFKKAYLTESNWLRGPGRLLSRQTSSDGGVVTSLGFDSNWIIVGMDNNNVHVFSAHTGQYVRQLTGHTLGVWCLVLVSKSQATARSAHHTHSRTASDASSSATDDAQSDYMHDSAAALTARSASARPPSVPRFFGFEDQPSPTIGLNAIRTQSVPVLDESAVHHSAGKTARKEAPRMNRRPSSFCGVASADQPEYARLDNARGFPFGDASGVSSRQAAACGTAMGYGQPGALAVTGGCDRDVRVWDVETGRCKHVLRGHMSTVRCLKVLDGRPIAISGSRDATLRVWDIEEGVLLRTLSGHQHSVRCVEISGNRAVSGSYDTTCRLWDVDSGECIHLLRGHTHQIYAVAFDGVRVASGSLDSTVRIWSAKGGQCLALLQGHTSLVGQLQLTDSVLVTGGSDGRVIVFSLSTFECLHRLCAHDNSVTCLQFNDRFMVTGGNDGRVKLWDRPSGKLIRELADPCEAIWRVTFREDKCVLLCKRGGKTVMDVRTFAPRADEL